MKVVLAGAFGNLGFEILKELIAEGHEVVAADRGVREHNGLEGKYTFRYVNALEKESFRGLCDGADVVITTMGLTGPSKKVSNYDIDYRGNMYLYASAKAAGVKKFNYVSVLACREPGAKKIPMLNAKALSEKRIMSRPMDYVIYRPTGYFYDICRVFGKYVDRGKMTLLKSYFGVKANVVDCPDLARFIVQHMNDTNMVYEVGGKETYTYEQMARMCFKAAGKPLKVGATPAWVFDILADLPKIRKEGKRSIILFSKWTLSHDLIGKDIVGESSFAEYIKEYFASGKG